MSKREPQISAHHSDGFTGHILLAKAESMVARGKATWLNPTCIKVHETFQPDPGKPQASTHSRLSREVGPYLASAYCRDRNKEGWAYAAVQQMRQAREAPSYDWAIAEGLTVQ